MSDSEWLHLLQLQTAICTVVLVLILLLRVVLLRMGHAAIAYTSWALLPLTLAASFIPHPAAELPTFTITLLEIASGPVTALAAPDTGIPAQRLWLLTWLGGAGLASALLIWQQWRFQSSLGLLQSAGNVYQARSNTAGPMLIGLLRPRIVVPADFVDRYSPEEQALILTHERVHLRRGDLFANALAALLQIVFWFNPLIYFAAPRFRFDQELACDSAVLQQHPAQRKTYAATILKTQLSASRLPLGCHWQSRHPLKDRIVQLTRHSSRPANRIALQAVLAALAFGSCYGAWAVSNTDTRPADLSPPPPPPPVGATATAVPAPPSPPAADIAPPPRKPAGAKAPPPPPSPADVAVPPPLETATANVAVTEYEVAFKHHTENTNTKVRNAWTTTTNLRISSGRSYQLSFGKSEPRCDYQLKLDPRQSPTGEPLAFIDLQFKCSDGEDFSGNPRLLTPLGVPATVRMSKDGQSLQHEFTLVITPKAM